MPEREDFTVDDVLDDAVRVNRVAYAALREFRRSKPWRGTFEERLAKFKTLVEGLAGAYGIDPVPTFEFRGDEDLSEQGNGAYLPGNIIVLVGKLSVVTLLHCICKARGMDRRESCRWSLSIFRRMFPRSFASCRAEGASLVRDTEPTESGDDSGEE